MARAGDVIGGKYRLIHPLGIGGMGAVWRAEHLALKQQVAVKLLDARGPAADRAVKRFQREAQIAASIRHRNIVYISDFGTDGGAPYLVMELLSGVPLSERIVVGEPLTVATFLRIVEETLQGLAAVHAAGVVHRDMKPENVFLVREADGSLFPKLLDFGVSRSTERNAGHTITREGIVMGTPEYVSPEQARGKMADVRSDIYSLGVVIYEALAGRLPFQADNAADLIVAVLNADALPLKGLRPDLGDDLSVLVSKAMSRNPNDRFQTTEEMRAAILSILAAQPRLEEMYLPRRFHSPNTRPTTGPLDGSEAPPPNDAPFKHDESLRPTDSVPTGLPRSRRMAAIGVGAVAAVSAVVVLAVISGGQPRPSANAASAPEPQPVVEPLNQPAAAAIAEPPSEVSIELVGVPADGRIFVDGVLADGPTLHIARGTGTHDISVEAPGRESWQVSHDSNQDGRYALSLEPLPEKETRSSSHSRSNRSSSRRSTGTGGKTKKTTLLRTPDF